MFRVALAVLALTVAGAVPAKAEQFAAKSNWGCIANQGGRAVLKACSLSGTNSQITYIPNENVFYGPLRQNGQCLDIQNGQVVFAACNGGLSQTWKFSGNGQFNNSNSCIVGQGAALVVKPCPAAGTWVNASYHIVNVPALASVARGTPLVLRNGNMYNLNTNQMVAANVGALVSPGGGSLIGNDGGSLISTGGGGVMVGANASQLVAAGGGN